MGLDKAVAGPECERIHPQAIIAGDERSIGSQEMGEDG